MPELTVEDALKFRIARWQGGQRNAGADEFNYQKYVIQRLPELFKIANIPSAVKIAKEFDLYQGRIDILVYHQDNTYSICELVLSPKNQKPDLYFSFKLGKLLTYRFIFHLQYNIPDDKIRSILITGESSILPILIVQQYLLPLEIWELNEEIFKIYKRNGQR